MLLCDPIAHENWVVEFSFSARAFFLFPSQGGGEDSSGQRYSADPTGLLAERGVKGDKDQDGYMAAMRDKNSGDCEGFENYPLHPIKGSKLETPVTGLRRMSGKATPKAFDVKHQVPYGMLRAANTSCCDSIYNLWQRGKAAETPQRPHDAARI